jgi:[ribulose-bisphosphate carboxylase]-lysine N-methyltransferase
MRLHIVACLLTIVTAYLPQAPPQFGRSWLTSTTTQLQVTSTTALDSIGEDISQALKACTNKDEIAKTCKVKVARVSTNRLGLVATEPISKGECALAMPYDDRYVLSASLASKTVFKDSLPEAFDSWTGEAGLIALLVLNEVARAANEGGIAQPSRPAALQSLMSSWISTLPGPTDMENHPYLWAESDQEVLQFSSTNKIYKRMDDIEEDAEWLTNQVFTKDRARFPETTTWNGAQIPCFSKDGFKWAMAIVQSRSFFLDGSLRLIPFMDMCNHRDDAEEVLAGSMGTFGTIKGARLVTSQRYSTGDEVFCSYGPKSAADYLLEHGFCAEQSWKTAISELTFEIDSEDRFRDDKLDILEYETSYDTSVPMDPVQSFDVVSVPGRDIRPDPAMMQFLRFCKLGGTDAFLLESIFRKDAWGHMELPVSEVNERGVVNSVIKACQSALDEFAECPQGGPEVCAKLREAETKALTQTLQYFERDFGALDLKEYYQERRLKDLGLDSQWSPEDDMMDEDLSFGQTRTPGGADYDW